jgi:Subtilase family
MLRLQRFHNKRLLIFFMLALLLIPAIPVSVTQSLAATPVAGCAITPNLLGGQGFSVSGQGFSVSGQGFSVSGQGFSVSGQGFSLSGQGLNPLVVAAEIRDNPVTPGKWINDRLNFFLDSLGFNTDATAILIVDEFNTPDAHGFTVQRVLTDTLTAARARVPTLKIASFPVDISAANYSASAIASAIAGKVNDLRGQYRNFVLNMSFGLIPCADPGSSQSPAFNFNEALAVVNANNQATPSLAIRPMLECVIEVIDDASRTSSTGDDDKHFVAYFSYKNENAQLVTIPVGSNNGFSPLPKDRGQPTQFEPGRQRFVFAVPFNGSNLIWTLKGADGQSRTAIASRYSPRCAEPVPAPTQSVIPIVECVADLGGGSFEARFGYNNPNALGVKIPVGNKNKFSPLPINRGQVTTFAPGLHQNVFTVNFNGNDLRWTLNNKIVIANTQSPACSEQGSFGISQYLTQNLEVPQAQVGTYWNNLAGTITNDETQPLRQLLRDYLRASADPGQGFSATAVASSGNLRPWLGGTPLAPASWPETIAVGATLNDRAAIWQFSQNANVLAPGVGYPVGANSFVAGTSFAAPMFSALVGLCATIPGGLSFDGANPPLEPPVRDGAGNKILANALIGTDDLAPLACNDTLTVDIDIKPDSEPNRINLKSWGKLAVAILSSATFDASQVNPRTVKLAGAPVIIKPNGKPFAELKDVNDDNRLDLVVRVRIQDLQLTETSTEAILIGMTLGGKAIQGKDKVSIVQAHGPELKAPRSGSIQTTSTFKLTWTLKDEEEEANTCFLVQIDNQSNFSSPEQSSTVVRSLSYTTAPLTNGLYYWRVAVSDCASTVITPWSATWSFTVRVR